MIQIAESRGLFGGRGKKASPYMHRKVQKKKGENVVRSIMLGQGKRCNKDHECGERISAPTIASLLRRAGSRSTSPLGYNSGDCPRMARAVEPPPDLNAR